ncbi:MAG: hypothetical protein ILP18_09310 [Treponema sp.]|nr:hypothetical protein [Treponema sp.]
MKKLISALLLGGLVMTGTLTAQTGKARTAVVYFSATGTTERMAKDADFKGGKDFTGKSGSDVKNYVDGLLK